VKELVLSSQPLETYLESQVMTATPQRLRLMLIDGAIRFARQAIQFWGDDGAAPESIEAVVRCRAVISELLSSVREDGTELPKQVAGIYLFLFQNLTEAQLNRDVEKVEETVRVLEVERETWTQVCEQFPEAPDPALIAKMRPKEITAKSSGAIPPPPHAIMPNDEKKSTGFSIEA
jgi:flagellar protein FliS